MGTTESKTLHIVSGLDGQHLQTITVAEDTKIRDILIQFHQEGKGLVTLLRGVQRLQPNMTVSEAGLEDGEELSLLWSKNYYETARLGEHDVQSDSMDQYKDLLGGIYVQIPDTVDCIEHDAFRRCKRLTEVVIPDSITSIGDYAFCGCHGLTQVVIPNSVTSIGELAFGGCHRLTQVVIPNSVTRIGDHAFAGCHSLTEVVMSKSLKPTGQDVFLGCTSLEIVELV